MPRAALAVAVVLTAAAALAQAPLDVLRVWHPNTLAFAAPFKLIGGSGVLADYAKSIEISEWTTPDILRSVLVNRGSEVTAVPTYVGANLANRGVDVKMAAVLVWGLLWMIGPDGAAPEWESLRGQTVLVPFANDMPDLVFQSLAVANGLTPGEDFTVQYFATPQDVVAQLVSGRGQWAVLPEHVATVALANANKNGQALGRFLNLQDEWAVITGRSRIPQAGIVVPTWLAEERPDVLGGVLTALEQAVAEVNAADADTIATLAAAFDLPEPVLRDVIPRLNLQVVPAAEARAELEAFYGELAVLSPDIIGGGLPDASFYLADPRE
ncbi:MAG: ABC transporter substrate-binding protein [Trueperaceae bacterium]|nr:ABC transporter substrate-binding protein [Trueperaceae bacterium]